MLSSFFMEQLFIKIKNKEVFFMKRKRSKKIKILRLSVLNFQMVRFGLRMLMLNIRKKNNAVNKRPDVTNKS